MYKLSDFESIKDFKDNFFIGMALVLSYKDCKEGMILQITNIEENNIDLIVPGTPTKAYIRRYKTNNVGRVYLSIPLSENEGAIFCD